MRLDAMCCEVSLSRWIEPGRLTVALWYQQLHGRGEGCSLVVRGLKSQSFVAASCCLLCFYFSGYQLSLRHCWPITLLVWQRWMCGLFFFFLLQKWFDRHRNWACEQLTGEKLHECDKNAPIWLRTGACEGAKTTLWAVLYKRTGVGWNKHLKTVTVTSLDCINVWTLKGCICTCSKMLSQTVATFGTFIFVLVCTFVSWGSSHNMRLM